jgi:uncharacterized protein involved in type VI secretion and phage assembly
MNLLLGESRDVEHEAGGLVQGVTIGIVTNNRDDTGLGRVKVRFPWRPDKAESHWARIAVPMAGKNRGTWFLPEVGDEVLVAFDRGDPGHPYILGALWNGQARPPESNADGHNDLRILRSRKGHELAFDDGGEGKVELKLNDGKRLLLDDDGIQLEDDKGNGLAISTRSGGIVIEAKGKLTLKAQAISIEAAGTLEMKANATLSIRGSLVQIN